MKINNFLDNFLTFFKFNKLNTVKQLWKKYLIPQYKIIVASIILMIIASALEALSIKMLDPVFNDVFIAKNKEILSVIGLQIVFLFATKGIANYFEQVMMSKVGLNMVKRVQIDLFEHITKMDLEFLQSSNSGDLLVYFIGDINAVKDAILNGITTMIKEVCTVVFLIILMFIKSPKMAAATFFIFPLAFYPLVYFGKKVKKMTKQKQMSSGGLFGALNQSFQSMKIIKSYCIEDAEIKRINNDTDIIRDISLGIVKIKAILSPLMEFFGGVAIAATLTYGGWQILNNKLTTGDFMVFLMAIIAAYKPLKQIAGLNVSLQIGMVSIERISKLFNSIPTIKDRDDARDLKIKDAKIIIDDVCFNYNSDREILHNINMTIEPNKTTAIIGVSGSGKSTLINLLMRFYDIKTGSIKIDDQDIRSVTLKSLRQNIAFVSQDVVLFDDTIKNNIIFGKENVYDEEVIDVAKKAAAHDFIMQKEFGYNTKVGEKGSRLSGGQKQMISIARAMLKNSPILLLDEATSSLDSKSENLVQQSLEKLMKGRTTVVIAHRLSTIINADKIYVFSEGRIVEEGRHSDLLALGGYYANLYGLQFKNCKDK